LKKLIVDIGQCQDSTCNKSSSLEVRYVESRGFAPIFTIECMDCGWSHRFGSSPEISLPEKDSRGAKTELKLVFLLSYAIVCRTSRSASANPGA